MQIQTLVSTVTNISSSFLAIFNNISALFGLGKDVSKPIEETFDAMFNNAFGKENVDYVKFQLAKVNSIFTAGSNILKSLTSASNTLGNAVETNANNTSKIGNALKAAGVLDEKMKWMDEQIQVKIEGMGKLTELNNSLNTVESVSTNLQSITKDLLTSKQELDKLDKDYEEKKKQSSEGVAKAEETHTDKEVVEIPLIKQGDV